MTTSTSPTPAQLLDERHTRALAKTKRLSTSAVRLYLDAREMIALGLAGCFGRWRAQPDRTAQGFAEHKAVELDNQRLRMLTSILSGRLARFLPVHRTRYSPEERFEIVTYIRTFALSYREAAKEFHVNEQTIGRWIHELDLEPNKTTIGSLLKPVPPLQTIDDSVRGLVVMLDALKVGGSLRIAQTLVRETIRISDETVRKIRKNARKPAPLPEKKPTTRFVKAKYPNHVWMADITDVPGLLKASLWKLVVIFDVKSRFPLAFRVFDQEPSSEEMANLFRSTVEKLGRPKHFISDQGEQFRGDPFVQLLKGLGTKKRFGAIGQHGSIAIIERFWRTVKEMLDLNGRPPLSKNHLEERIDLGLFYYATIRPHQSFKGATPAEIYFGITPRSETAVPALRARTRLPGEIRTTGLEIRYLDSDGRLPVLVSIEDLEEEIAA